MRKWFKLYVLHDERGRLQQQVKLLRKYGYEKWSRITGYFKRFAME